MTKVHLADEFPPVSAGEWEEQIRRDLKGADYGETLLWHLDDGLTVRPYYRAEDVAALEPPDRDAVEIVPGWKLRQDIRTPDLEKAAAQVRSAIDGRIDVLGIDLRIEGGRCRGVPIFRKEDLAALLPDVPGSNVALHLGGGAFSPTLFAFFLDSVGERMPAVTLGFDPVAESARRGRRLVHLLDLAADSVRFVADGMMSDARVLAVGSGPFHEAGATTLQENALLLASMSELFVQMMDRGLPPEQVLDRLIIETSIGSSYFVEIARLRALRLLIRQLIDVFVPEHRASLPPIHAATSARNTTLYDPHANMLRSTTEAASAMVGGCDVVSVHLFDEVGGRYDEFSYRMARNTQHILRFEAGFARVADPAAGSYFVEVLTDAFARRAWQLFQEIESEGGFFEALENGFIHRKLEAARIEEREAFAERRSVLVGTNDYPEIGERRANAALELAAGNEIPVWEGAAEDARSFDDLRRLVAEGCGLGLSGIHLDGPSNADPLPHNRLAEPLERIRLRTERHGCALRGLLVPFGDPASRSSRAFFAANFLGCGGFAIESPAAFDDVDSIVQTIRADPPDILVYCADDNSYATVLPNVQHHLNELNMYPVRILVGSQDVLDDLAGTIDLAIRHGSDLIGVLDELHDRLGVARDTPKESRL